MEYLLITSWWECEKPGCLRLNRLGRIQASTPFHIGTSGIHAQTPSHAQPHTEISRFGNQLRHVMGLTVHWCGWIPVA